MVDDISLRPASPDDIPALLAVIQGAFEEYRDKFDPPSGALGETEETLVAQLQKEEAAIAQRAGVIVGCVFYDTTADAAYFHRLAVMPSQRGQGIGHLLIEHVEGRASEAGQRHVRLAVRVTLPEMRRYYELHGYRVIEHRSHPGYALPTFFVMEKDLEDPFDFVAERRRRNIVVVAYDPAWPALYADEAARLAELFGDELVDIHHIGSTAIVGIHAKPIIDMLPVVRDIERINALNPRMIAAGYDPLGENDIPGRRYFNRREDGAITVHIHAFEVGHPDVARHVDFCAYLNAHPGEAQRYGEIKKALVRQYPHDVFAYTGGKTPFILDTETKAKAWRAAMA